MKTTQLPKIHLLVVHDQHISREGLKQVLSAWSDMRVVGECATLEELSEAEGAEDADVVLLAPRKADIHALRAIRGLSRKAPEYKLLIIGPTQESHYVLRCLRAGAVGYLARDCPPDELARAIRRVHEGGRYVTPELGEQLTFQMLRDGGLPPHERLSPREYEVMCLLAQGKTVRQIAKELVLSPKTISTHRAKILHKMRLESTGQIIRYALEENLV